MKQKIRVGIIGYGNLGRGAELALKQQEDMELVAIFSRRGAAGVTPVDADVTVEHVEQIEEYRGKIDVMILCGGSATDLPEQTPQYTKWFNTVDSFDTHAKIPEHFQAVDEAAKEGGTVSVVAVGWDPGLFSMNRVLSEAILPKGETYTFWGKGLSQGHSDAIRRINGVKAGVQYTIPVEEAMERVRKGENPDLATNEKHQRVCYVVPEEGADKDAIEHTIKTMPNYFADYDTTVHFITQEELETNHSQMPHGGFVIRSGQTGEGTQQLYELKLELDSNPEFTASILVAYARAAYRLHQENVSGAKTVFDIGLSYISPKSNDILRRDYL